jgi:hypothetical protein
MGMWICPAVLDFGVLELNGIESSTKEIGLNLVYNI